MELTAGNSKIWKRKADESEAAARSMTRTAAILALMSFAALAYAMVAQARFSGLCNAITYEQEHAVAGAQDFARNLANGHCE